MNRYLVILLLLSSPAAAKLEPYKGSDGRIFPGLEPYWGSYTPRQAAPRIGVDGGRANREYRLSSRDGWNNDAAPGTSYNSPGNHRGSNVSISLPDGPPNIREAIQGAIQDFGRMFGWGDGGGGNDGVDTSGSSSNESLSGSGCCSGDRLGGSK